MTAEPDLPPAEPAAVDGRPIDPPKPAGDALGRSGPRVRDRDVYLLAAAVVAAVLVFNLVSAAIRPLDQALAIQPVIVMVMIVVTLLVLYRSVRSGSRRD